MVRIAAVFIFIGLLVVACGRSEPETTLIEDEVAGNELATQQKEEPQEVIEEVAEDEPATEAGVEEAKLVKVYKSPT